MEDKIELDENLIAELSKSIKTQADLAKLSQILLKTTVERALDVEMDEHLGYEKHSPAGRNSGNSRNGKSKKTIKGSFGELDITTPRDRDASFSPN